MGQETFLFKGANGQDVFTRSWVTESTPAGILQIFHGLAEHAERYEDFAEYMNLKGFNVYACDQRGHGRTGEMNYSLFHYDNEGFNGTLEDQKLLANIIKEKYPGTPHFIMGHSFGSFVAQEFIKRCGEISGVILSSSSKMSSTLVMTGRMVSFLSLAFGRRRPNFLINNIISDLYNKAIKNPRSKFDWLSNDEDQVKKYDEDKFCGGVLSTNFYYYFFKGLGSLYNTGSSNIPAKLPVYIMSGDMDPLGDYGKGVERLYDWYKSLGIEDLQLKLYKGGRHEMLNELNRTEVYNDISSWLLKHVTSRQNS